MSDGKENVQILTDYDQTLVTAKFTDGGHADSSFKTLINSPHMPEENGEKARQLYAHYRPIELDR